MSAVLLTRPKPHTGVPADHFPSARHLAARTRARMAMVPASTGIGAPGTQPAPADLARSPMSAAPSQQAQAIPFTRGSAMSTMQDATRQYAPGAQDQIQLQTNAFLEYVILDFSLAVTANAETTVAFAEDGPFSVISKIQLDDPAGQSIITPITGYQLFLLNKWLPDTNCGFDPQLDPNFSAITGTGATAGSFSFRLILPVEHRSRDALGAVNNSAGNQRYLITLTIAGSGATFVDASIYDTPPSAGATVLSLKVSQWYWTSPPQQIVTAQGAVPVAGTPSGLGTVGFVRYERHNEVDGGGSPQIQLNNVGDYISTLIFVLRADDGTRDAADWPPQFQWWVNDFQVHNLYTHVWQRRMARALRYTAAIGAPGGLDVGVFILPGLNDGLFDQIDNFAPANQYLATDATTKLQIRGSTFGSGAAFLEVITRLVRPVSGAALFS